MPIDLNTSEADTASMAEMRAADTAVETVAEPAVETTTEPAKTETVAEPAAAATTTTEPAKTEPAKAEPDAAETAKLARQVPFGAVVEERGKRKAAEGRLQEAMAELARLRGTPQAPQPTQERPSAETDPIAVIQELRREADERREQDRQAGEFNTFQQTVVAKEQEFVRENPEYPKMVDFLKETRVKELRDGLGLNDQQIAQALAMEARDTAAYALNHDLNPAEVFARLAVAKGYKAPAPEPEPAKPAAAATEKLDTIARGMKAGKSLGSGGGSSPEANITLTSVAAMSNAEFDAAWKNGTIKSLMG